VRASASTFAVGLFLSVALPAGVALADPGEQILLDRANYWREQHRFDLASEILDKVLALNPGQPDALYQQGMLAAEQGDSDRADNYFNQLRQLARRAARAAELLAVLPPQSETPASAESPVAVNVPAPVAADLPDTGSSPGNVAPAAQRRSELAAASADSEDLVPAKAPALNGTRPKSGSSPQVASLPQTTVSDDKPAAVAASAAGSADLGIKGMATQVAQVELEPPLPVDGYQRPVTSTPYSPTDTLEMDIDRNLAQLESQANPMLIAGLGVRAHSGDEGLNRLTEVGVPVQGSFSPWYTGTASIAILPVWLDAGSVSSGNLASFGANPLLFAAKKSLSVSGEQTATGVGLLGGYTLGDFSGQFGTSPLGFPVSNLVGMAAYAPKFFDNTLTVRIEGLRQPVTDSVLSYAGTHANLSGVNAIAPGAFGTSPIWGGVVKTGGHLTAFYDDQMYGAYGGAGAAWLTGDNVAGNSVIDALLGAYFRPFKYENWTLKTGISLYYAGYDKNLSGFSFGQGGYFSPQDYEALTFPIEYTGHSGPWSYLASVALGIQHFNERSSPVFPNNPSAQLALEALSPSTAFLGSTHNTGPAFNIKGQLEYAIDDTLSLGVAASLDNGNDYTEGIGKIYLRKTFDWFAPVAKRDDPESVLAHNDPLSRL
jgi:hypothetical protein